MSGAELRRTLKVHGVSQKQAAAAAGIPQTTLSGWCNAQHVDDDKADMLLQAAGIKTTDKVIEKPAEETIETLTPEQVAAIWGVSPSTIRAGIQQGVFPWAYAIKTSDTRWTYLINAERFRETERPTRSTQTLRSA